MPLAWCFQSILKPNGLSKDIKSIQKLCWLIQILAHVMAAGIDGIGGFKHGKGLGIWQKERPIA